MKISHISPGRFHHISLCRLLDERGVLDQFFIAYPRQKLKDDGLPMDRVRCFPWLWGLYHLRRRAGHENDPLTKTISLYAQSTLSRYAAGRLRGASALIAMSNSGLEAGREIKRMGGVWLCDRGSAHIRYQDQLLADEHLKWGVPYEAIDPRTIEREVQEYEEAHAVLVPSEFARRSFLQQGVPASRIVKIPYGVDLRDFYPGEGRTDGPFRVLFVGGVTLQKGIPYLLEAVSKLRGDVELAMVGEAANMPASVLERFDTSRVKWVGRQNKGQVREWMQKSDVLVLPSVQDGFGLVLAEAMACGCPVIATTHTGIEDLIDDGVEGYVIPPQDVIALTDRVQALVDDPRLRQLMSEASVARVASLGGWDAYGDTLVATVKKIVDEN